MYVHDTVMVLVLLLVPFVSPQAQGDGSSCSPETVPSTTTILLDTYNTLQLFSNGGGWNSLDENGDGMMVRIYI